MIQNQARIKWKNSANLAESLAALAYHLQEQANRAETREEWLYRQGIAIQADQDAAEARANERIAWAELQAVISVN